MCKIYREELPTHPLALYRESVGVGLDLYDTFNIEGIQFGCTDGESSGWYGGDTYEEYAPSFDLAVTSVRSQQVLNVSAYRSEDYPLMGTLFIGGYVLSSRDLEEQEYGPFA